MKEQIKIKRITMVSINSKLPPRFVILDTQDNIYNYQPFLSNTNGLDHNFDVLAIAQEGDTLEINFIERPVDDQINVNRRFVQHVNFIKESLE